MLLKARRGDEMMNCVRPVDELPTCVFALKKTLGQASRFYPRGQELYSGLGVAWTRTPETGSGVPVLCLLLSFRLGGKPFVQRSSPLLTQLQAIQGTNPSD